MKNNADYKASADLHYRLRIFNVGDCDGLFETMVSSRNCEEIACAKCINFLNPQEDQSKCLCGGSPIRFWH